MADQVSAQNAIWILDGQAMGDRQLTVSIREEAPVKPAYGKIGTAAEPVKKKRPRKVTATITPDNLQDQKGGL